MPDHCAHCALYYANRMEYADCTDDEWNGFSRAEIHYAFACTDIRGCAA